MIRRKIVRFYKNKKIVTEEYLLSLTFSELIEIKDLINKTIVFLKPLKSQNFMTFKIHLLSKIIKNKYLMFLRT